MNVAVPIGLAGVRIGSAGGFVTNLLLLATRNPREGGLNQREWVCILV